jgi:hypothetical protein
MNSYKVTKKMPSHKCRNCGEKGHAIFRGKKYCRGCLDKYRRGNSINGLTYVGRWAK